jgi:PAS domain S-box-containing protein
VCLVVCAGVTLLKVSLGHGVGREAPFALFGLAVILAGWLGDARSALLATPILTLAWWHYFLEPGQMFALDGPWTLMQLVVLSAEGLGISFILGQMEKARDLVEAQMKRSQHLQMLASALSAATGPDQVAAVIVEQMGRAIGATSGVIVRCVAPRELQVIARQGSLGDSVSIFLIPEPGVEALGPIASAFESGRAEWTEGQERCAARAKDHPALRISELAAEVTLPLAGGRGQVLAVLDFQFQNALHFSASERELIAELLVDCSQALERAQLHADEVATRRKLIELDGLTTALSQALTRDDVARIVVERGMAAAGADVCTLYIFDERAEALELIASRGVAPEVLERILRITADSGNPVFESLSSGKARWAESMQDYRAISPELANLRTSGPRASAFWSVPLITEGKAAGLLGMGFFQPRRFPAEERMFVETFARHCAEALRRADRLDAERRARATSERLKSSLLTTLRSIGDAVIATDAAGGVTFMNPVAEQLTGWRESEAQGHPLREVFHIINEETRAEVETPVDRVLREGIVVGLANHTLLVARDGKKLTPIDDSGAPIRSESGQIDGVVLVFRDVSAKKREEGHLSFLSEATRALGESLDYEATLNRVSRLAVPQIADWVVVDVVEEGQAGAKRLAVTHADPAKIELVNEIQARYPPDPRAPRGTASVLRTGRSQLYPEITREMLETASQNEEHLRLNQTLSLRSAMIVPLIARGQTLGVMTFAVAESARSYGEADLAFAEELCRRCALAIDNSRLFLAEQRARHSADLANHAKDEFLATVSHELRTPLNAIMGWARLLSAGGLEPTKSERGLQTIERNAVAMARLIEDILDVSRIISGKMRVDLQVVDLGQVIESAIESVRPAAEAKSVQMLAALDATAGPILGDPTRIQQVIWNLLSNAVKFNFKDGKVEVRLRRIESTIEIRVTDTGKGIEKGFLPHVFDPFRQAESGYARGRSGLGLGLAIARQLTELHGGQLEATSDGEGKGATFTVRFPVPAVTRTSDFQRSSAPPRRIPSESRLEAPPQALRGLRVLVVDDDEDARTLVKAVLEACGSAVRTASSAAEGMSAIARETPDVLISDIGMPGEDGYDLIRRVRALPSSRGGDIPAAALTAFARAEDRRRVLSAGYSTHIPKPVEPAELVAAVASLTKARTAAPPIVQDN